MCLRLFLLVPHKTLWSVKWPTTGHQPEFSLFSGAVPPPDCPPPTALAHKMNKCLKKSMAKKILY